MLPRVLRMPLLVSAICLFVLSISFAQDIIPPKPASPYLTERYEVVGDDLDGALKNAHVRAINSAVGRLYFTDYMLRARTLVEPYVSQHHKEFIVREEIFENRLRGGQRFLDVEVVVDCEKLWADLVEKRFIYRPAFRPLFYVFMSETFDEAEVTSKDGRNYLLELMNGKEMAAKFDKLPYRYLWQDPPLLADDPNIPASDKSEVVMTTISPYKDPSVDMESLMAACREAQRNEVEVFVAGSIETKTVKKEKLYFDDYTYVETYVSLKLVRSDNGEILFSRDTRVSGAHKDAAEARRMATYSALNKIAPPMFAAFDAMWDKMILRAAKLRIMAVGQESPQLDTIKELIKAAVPNVDIYTRSEFSNIGVINIDWDGDTADLIQRLKLVEFPQMHIVFVAPNSMILELL
ncbi:MAG: hypothetical protein ACLFQ6_12630 [Candidatus Sumerlaeia bacterium]